MFLCVLAVNCPCISGPAVSARGRAQGGAGVQGVVARAVLLVGAVEKQIKGDLFTRAP